MFFYQGQSCPVCNKPFQPDEDIVSCPSCGAPHHRECWKNSGGCHFAADHGTERQWSRDNVQTQAQPQSTASDQNAPVCPRCGFQNTDFAEFCARCGSELPQKEWRSTQQQQPPKQAYGTYTPFTMPHFDPMGGVAPDEKIEDATAEEMKALVGVNPQYYLPKFVRMSKTNSHVSWNWAAFLLPSSWLLYRKNILPGFAALFFFMFEQVASAILIKELNLLANGSFSQLNTYITQVMQGPESFYLYLLTGLMLLRISISVLCGLFGNRLYYESLLRKARRLRNDSVSPSEFSAYGGVSLMLGTFSYMMLWFVDLFFNYL